MKAALRVRRLAEHSQGWAVLVRTEGAAGRDPAERCPGEIGQGSCVVWGQLRARCPWPSQVAVWKVTSGLSAQELITEAEDSRERSSTQQT